MSMNGVKSPVRQLFGNSERFNPKAIGKSPATSTTTIETGNHIAHAAHSRRERGEVLADLMKKSANQETPWAAFSEQSVLWSPEKLVELADSWPDLAAQQLSLGDATIKDVAEYYAQMGYRVGILTGDAGLKAYQPAEPTEVPRRKQRR